MEDGSFGFQIGASSTDVVILIMNEEGMNKLLSSKFTLGADAAVAPGQAVHCRIWNGVGLVLEDEEFLPYDGGAPPASNELGITTDPSVPGGPDRIFLNSGR